jgi:hypothetical protein
MIFRAEQRRNAALHEIEQYRNGAAERMRRLQSQSEEDMLIRPLPRGVTVIRTARANSNRRNARRSTGPKSAAGKAKVAKNALRHGLAVPARLDSALSQEIEELAELIAGRNVAPYLLNCAQRVAEAQIDLRRIRRVRLWAWSKVETGELRQGGASPEISEASSGHDSLGAAELNTFAKQLLRLDGYERRALSRRKAAIREFESIVQRQ